MEIQSNGYVLPIPKELVEVINQAIENSGKIGKEALYLNFRDPSYSPENGGFHPVEVMVSGAGVIQYITDFAYVGYPAELVKEVDFDFAAGIFQHFGEERFIGNSHTFFNLWQFNFCTYYKMGVYNVTVKEVL